MKVEFSKAFIKSASKLSGKMKSSLKNVILEVENADSMLEVSDCKKLIGYRNVYRIRIGDYRTFVLYHVYIENNVALFQYLVSRGEAFRKYF